MAHKGAQTKSRQNTVKKPVEDYTSKYFARLLDIVATAYLALTVIALPLFMSREKYTAITAAKSGFFSTLSVIVLICMILLFTSMFLYSIDGKKHKRMPLRRSIVDQPPLLADIAIIAYWAFMLISCMLADDPIKALYGLEPRDNGFFYQTLYVAAYFIISRTMKPTRLKATIFVWGGAILALVSILHYFGIDLYDVVNYHALNSDGQWVSRKLSESYAGPFWDSTSYRFLGPVGNVNLGSYILCVALVIAAGLYITGVQPEFFLFRFRKAEKDDSQSEKDNGKSKSNKSTSKSKENKDESASKLILTKHPDRHGISLLICFMIILFAELNINTDAGLVAMAAAIIAVPIVLCGTLQRFSRAMIIFAAAALVVISDIGIDTALRGDELGTTIKVLRLLTLVLIILAVAVQYAKNNDRVRSFVTTKRLRTVLTSVVALAVVGGVILSLVITIPDNPAAGPLSGASVVLTENDLEDKSDTIIHELGQMLRGNFDDSFGHNRLFTWKRTLSLVKYRPVFGIGPDNFQKFFAEHYHDEAVAMFPSSNGNLDKAHNEFLDVLLDNGIIGLVSYLTFFGALLWYCFRNADRNTFAPVFGVAVFSYMAHAFFGYQLPIQSPVMWMMIGAAGAFARLENTVNPTGSPNN